MAEADAYADYTLRPMQQQDMQTVYDWRKQPDIARYMFSDDEITLDEHQRWFQRTLDDKSVDYQILVYRGKAIGLANATDIDNSTGRCHWGFYIGDTQAPKGSGTIMGKLMLHHIFEQHPVTTIVGEAFAFNSASLKLHDRLGFIRYPELSRTLDKDGKTEQVIVMQLDATDYNIQKHDT